jgi:hypothetical protein
LGGVLVSALIQGDKQSCQKLLRKFLYHSGRLFQREDS